MSDARKDGGPAFPTTPEIEDDGSVARPFEGMSLRDWFAGQAPSIDHDWLFTEPYPVRPKSVENKPAWAKYRSDLSDYTLRKHAAWRLAFADAMIAARSLSDSGTERVVEGVLTTPEREVGR